MKRGDVEIRIGLGSCGIASGAEPVRDILQQAGEVKTVGCNGMCHLEPLVQVVEPGGRVTFYSNVTVEMARRIVRQRFSHGAAWEAAAGRGPAPQITKQKRIVLENCGEIDPLNIDDYLARDGYRALERCRKHLSPEQVVAAIAESGLRGRGGAGFPTGRKWALGRAQADPVKYVVCNGDEGDPGAFMDRVVLESTRIASSKAWPSPRTPSAPPRATYTSAPNTRWRCATCAPRSSRPRARGIPRSPLHLEVRGGRRGIRLRRGDGADRSRSKDGAACRGCGRPTRSSRASAASRPSSITSKPRLVPWIVRHGARRLRRLRHANQQGDEGLCAGRQSHPRRPDRSADGHHHSARSWRRSAAASGTAGSSRPCRSAGRPAAASRRAWRDTPIDYEALAQTGAIMGSGGLVVLDDRDCMVDIARFFLRFTQAESCGKCTFCRIGTKRMLEILDRLCEGNGRRDDLEKLETLADYVSRGQPVRAGPDRAQPGAHHAHAISATSTRRTSATGAARPAVARR